MVLVHLVVLYFKKSNIIKSSNFNYLTIDKYLLLEKSKHLFEDFRFKSETSKLEILNNLK